VSLRAIEPLSATLRDVTSNSARRPFNVLNLKLKIHGENE